eukprot:475568-Pyramimonas_sp.AAC.1
MRWDALVRAGRQDGHRIPDPEFGPWWGFTERRHRGIQRARKFTLGGEDTDQLQPHWFCEFAFEVIT